MEFFLERIETKPLCVHYEMVPFRFPETLREVIRRFPPGVLRLELGIQSFNPKTREFVSVSGNINEELEILEFLRRETNAIVHADLIAGLPGENLDSFGAGFDRLWQVMAGDSFGFSGSVIPGGITFEIQLGILKCLPGTSIVRHNDTHGMRYSAEPPYEVIETDALSAGELERIKNFARFWELIVNRNPFPELIQGILPPGENAFNMFMALSDKLLERFGKNWGIDRKELKLYLEALPPAVQTIKS
jgi:hypothetical protein